jgi:hypothetical protein
MAEQYFKAKDAKDAKANVVTTANKKTRVIVFPRQGEKLYEDVMRMGRKPKITERLIKLRTEPKKEQRRITVAMRPIRGKKASKAQEKIQKALEKKAAVKESRQAPILNLEQLAIKKQVEEIIAKREAPVRLQKAIEASKVPSQTLGIKRAPLAIEAAAVPDRPTIKGKQERQPKTITVEGLASTLKKDALMEMAKSYGLKPNRQSKKEVIVKQIAEAEAKKRSIEFPKPSIEELVAEEEEFKPVLSKGQKKKLKKAEEAEMKAREAEMKARKAEEEAIKREMQVINELDREIGVYADLGNVSQEELMTLVNEAESHEDWGLEKRYTFVRDSLAQVAREEQRKEEFDEAFRREKEYDKKKSDVLKIQAEAQAQEQAQAQAQAQEQAQAMSDKQKRDLVIKELKQREGLELPSREEILAIKTPTLSKTQRSQLTSSELKELEERYGLSSDGNVKERKQRIKELQKSGEISIPYGELTEMQGLKSTPEIVAREKELIKLAEKQQPYLTPLPADKPEAIPAFEGIEEPMKTQLKAGSLMGHHHGQLKKLKKRLGRDLEMKDIKKLQKAKMFGGKLNGGGFTDTLLDLGKKGLKAAVDYGIKNPDKVLGYAKKGFEMGKSILSKKKKGGSLQKTSVI